MTRVIVLDAGPLGLVSAPPRKAQSLACSRWLANRIAAGDRILIPEIADYEVRRELLRAGKTASVRRLDALSAVTEYVPITTAAMRKAAEFWALARQTGQPTAGDNTIDGDCILAVQAAMLGLPDVVIATTNVGHLNRFVAAESWETIGPGGSP
jgi:predicted nucleic acid-binding protein